MSLQLLPGIEHALGQASTHRSHTGDPEKAPAQGDPNGTDPLQRDPASDRDDAQRGRAQAEDRTGGDGPVGKANQETDPCVDGTGDLRPASLKHEKDDDDREDRRQKRCSVQADHALNATGASRARRRPARAANRRRRHQPRRTTRLARHGTHDPSGGVPPPPPRRPSMTRPPQGSRANLAGVCRRFSSLQRVLTRGSTVNASLAPDRETPRSTRRSRCQGPHVHARVADDEARRHGNRLPRRTP